MSFKTGAWQEADIKFNDMSTLEMPSEENTKIRAEVIYYAVSFHRIRIFTHP